ncbi:homeobox protein cut-like 1 [Branchiostoma floridae]|uniref:Homeobox protein cut-like 1 n=1 Tax=Branchiostoma floridae TaxID=7739 RepID=A0A9J7KKD7_BRAFL|nr:homeobox protein cut-like 1 [Branchiostoma floridae]
MTTPESRSCGLSRDVTLAVLPRLHLEEVVLELGRRNIHCGPESNNKELLTNVLLEVIKQEYYAISCQWGDHENTEPTVPNLGSPHSWAVSEEIIETAQAHDTTNDLVNETTNDLDNEVHAALSAADTLPSIPPTTATQQTTKPKTKVVTSRRKTRQPSIPGDVLDTEDVAKNIRKILHMNDLQQKCFAKHVLRRLPGIVGDLLNHPKPWKKLRPITRQLYTAMRDWMSPEKLVHNVLELKKLQRQDTYVCEKTQDPSTINPTNTEEAKNTCEELDQNRQENDTAEVHVRGTQLVDETMTTSSISNTIYVTPALSYTTQDTENQKEMSVHVLDDATEVLDPAQIANTLRDTLEKNKLTQAMFSRLVLQRGEGTFSELMNNPGPWEKMQPRRQNLYKTMKQWMEPDVLDRNVQELRTAWKNYKLSDYKLRRKWDKKSAQEKASPENHMENQAALQAILISENSKIQDSLPTQDVEAPSSSPHAQDSITHTHSEASKMSEATPLVNNAPEGHSGTACTNHSQPFSDCIKPQDVTLKLKEILKANKISYQIFARKVLRRSVGSLADLINYPLAWDRMTPARQKLYRTMWEWMGPDVLQKNIKELTSLRQKQASKPKKIKRDTKELQVEEECCSESDEETSKCTSDHTTAEIIPCVGEPQEEDSIPSNIPTDSQTEQIAQRDSTPILVTSLECTDTIHLVSELRTTLQKYDLSQRVFAKKVLGRAPSTFAEMLNSPKPWSKLTSRKRHLFTVIHQWLTSQDLQSNIHRLKDEEHRQCELID